jgi:ribosomal protein S12 methylthiotransferase accessory factor
MTSTPRGEPRLAFKPHFAVQVVPPDLVFLFTENERYVLEGVAYRHLAELLGQPRTASELVGRLPADVPAPSLLFALSRLRSLGYVAELPEGPRDGAAYWAMLGQAPAQARARLDRTTVVLSCVGNVDAAPLLAALAANGLRAQTAEPNGGAETVGVVLCDDYLRPELAAVNAHHRDTGRPWLLVKPTGAVLWVGPLFVPNQTACWECLATRLRGNREVETTVQNMARNGLVVTSVASLPSTVSLGAALAATEITRFIATASADEARLVALDTQTLRAESHPVVRLPRCCVCGNGGHAEAPRPIVLRPVGVVNDDGGLRSVTSEETMRRLERHVSPLTGVIGRVTRADWSTAATPVYLASMNTGAGSTDLYELRESLSAGCAGKGRTEIQSRVSAMAEAVERFAGRFHGEAFRRLAPMHQVEGAIHPNACMLFSDRQYRGRQEWNRHHVGFEWVPAPFDPDRPTEWTPIYSLTHDCFRHLPTAHLFYDWPLPSDHLFCKADSNGCAAGNTVEEAIIQGFLELVERDGVALWWYSRCQRPGIDLESVPSPYVAALRAHYAATGRQLWALDLTTDLGIPTIAALSRRVEAGREEILFGFGSHLDAGIALERALTELNQFLPSPSGQRPSRARKTGFEEIMDQWLATARLESHAYLAPAPGPARRLADLPGRRHTDLRDAVMACVEAAAAVGLETLVHDQTCPEVPLHVVKVVVPGLRHFWARFGPGRLYDVPVALGWVPQPVPEEELNPISMFL